MSLVRVHNFSISLDRFGREGQSDDAHFGHAGDRRPRKIGAVSATVLDTSISPRSKRPPTEEAR